MNICKRTLRTGNNKIEYTHEIKNVKNINVRVTPEKGLYVSSPPDVDIDTIERFLASKLDKIIPALDKINNTGTAAGNSPVKKTYDRNRRQADRIRADIQKDQKHHSLRSRYKGSACFRSDPRIAEGYRKVPAQQRRFYNQKC